MVVGVDGGPRTPGLAVVTHPDCGVSAAVDAPRRSDRGGGELDWIGSTNGADGVRLVDPQFTGDGRIVGRLDIELAENE